MTLEQVRDLKERMQQVIADLDETRWRGMKVNVKLKTPALGKIKIGNLTHGAIQKPTKQKRKTMDDLKFKLEAVDALMGDAERLNDLNATGVDESFGLGGKSPLKDLQAAIDHLEQIPKEAKTLIDQIREIQRAAGPDMAGIKKLSEIMSSRENTSAASTLKSKVLGAVSDLAALARAMPQWIHSVKQEAK